MSIAIAMIPLAKGARLSRTKTLADLNETWGLNVDPSNTANEKGILTISFGEPFAAVAMMAAPIPAEELAGPIQTSIFWPEAGKDLALSRGHLVVTMVTPLEEPIELRKWLTKVVASVLAGCEGVQGVYWAEAGILIRGDVFRKVAIGCLPDPPLPLWIDFRVGSEGDGKSAGFTHGMEALGLMEIECEAANESPAEFRERLGGIAAYLVANGLVIQNGHTIGEDANERIRVVYGKSTFGHENAVMRLEYEPVKKKSFWKRG